MQRENQGLRGTGLEGNHASRGINFILSDHSFDLDDECQSIQKSKSRFFERKESIGLDKKRKSSNCIFITGLDESPRRHRTNQHLELKRDYTVGLNIGPVESEPTASNVGSSKMVKVKLTQIQKPKAPEDSPRVSQAEGFGAKNALTADYLEVMRKSTLFKLDTLYDNYQQSKSLFNKSSSLQEDRSVSVGIDTNVNLEPLLQNNQQFMEYVKTREQMTPSHQLFASTKAIPLQRDPTVLSVANDSTRANSRLLTLGQYQPADSLSARKSAEQ